MIGVGKKKDRLRGPKAPHGGHAIYGRANPMDLIEGIEVLTCPAPPPDDDPIDRLLTCNQRLVFKQDVLADTVLGRYLASRHPAGDLYRAMES